MCVDRLFICFSELNKRENIFYLSVTVRSDPFTLGCSTGYHLLNFPFAHRSTIINVTSRPMVHPTLWAVFSAILNFNYYVRAANTIQSESDDEYLLSSVPFFSLFSISCILRFYNCLRDFLAVIVVLASFIIFCKDKFLFIIILFFVLHFLYILKSFICCFIFLRIIVISLCAVSYV